MSFTGALQEQKDMMETQFDNRQRIRRLQHDGKGRMAALAGQFCADPYLDAVFAHYFRKLEELGAECRMNIQVGEEALPDLRVCQILSDGLENVCDALKELTIEKRKASVQMKYNRDYLLIRMKNRCRDELYTDKGTASAAAQAGGGYGAGLAAMRKAAQSLDGEMFCYTENGNFVLDVMILRRPFQKKATHR